jgi:tRNA-dihydrouridine synthase A
MRIMSKHTRLYTEMITTGALLHGSPERFLAYHPQEHPLALQLGGSDPKALAQCAELAQTYGYAEINLNVGCPSERVKSGKFGACLMAEPQLVAECVSAMQTSSQIPVTVKTRLGIDDNDSYEFLHNFIETVAKAGCQHVIIHARKAWLSGLSPKENREIPPLCYERVHQLKQDFPQLTVIINGGIKDLEQVQEQLKYVDGVMLGRIAYQQPYFFADVDQQLFGETYEVLTRHEVVEQLLPYIDQQLTEGARLHHISRHLLNLFNGQPGARHWRRSLTEAAVLPASEGVRVLRETLKISRLSECRES